MQNHKVDFVGFVHNLFAREHRRALFEQQILAVAFLAGIDRLCVRSFKNVNELGLPIGNGSFTVGTGSRRKSSLGW